MTKKTARRARSARPDPKPEMTNVKEAGLIPSHQETVLGGDDPDAVRCERENDRPARSQPNPEIKTDAELVGPTQVPSRADLLIAKQKVFDRLGPVDPSGTEHADPKRPNLSVQPSPGDDERLKAPGPGTILPPGVGLPSSYHEGFKPGPVEFVSESQQMLSMIERLASNPEFDVTKLQALVDMQHQSVDRQRARSLEDEARVAEKAFTAAEVLLQADLPVVTEKGEIWNKAHTEVVATYAKWEDINEVLKPILSQHGFTLAFETINLESGQLQTLGFLRHVGGHVRQSQFTGAPDESGFKNATQGIGSIRSYGKRYCAQDLLNLTSRGEDDDGKAAHVPEPPPNYEPWWHIMGAFVDQGIRVLQEQWNKTRQVNPEFCLYTTEHRKEQWGEMKQKALAVTQHQTHVELRDREPGEEG